MHDATTDPARIRALFAAAPWATGYGIACAPPPHHLIGIDLDTTSDTKSDTDSDTDSASALRELALRRLFTIPPTVVVLTPSSGRHLWLTGPPDVVVPNSASRLAPGIGIWGAGGYLVGPGSRTAHGVYATAPGTTHLTPAPCPRSLLRLPLPPPRSPHAGRPDTGVGFEPTVTSLPRRFSRSLGGRGAGTLRSRSDGYEHACGPVIIVIVPATCPRLMVVPAQPGVGRFGNLVVATGDRSGVVPGGDARGGMAEPMGSGHDAVPVSDPGAVRGPEVMRRHVGQPGRRDGGVEVGLAPLVVAQRLPRGRGEQERVIPAGQSLQV